jgi:hypothetical protein
VAAITGYWVMLPVTRDPLDNDFTLVFIAVRIGFEHGWSNIYSSLSSAQACSSTTASAT